MSRMACLREAASTAGTLISSPPLFFKNDFNSFPPEQPSTLGFEKKTIKKTKHKSKRCVCATMAADSSLSRIAKWLKVKVPEACPDCDEPDVLAEVRNSPNCAKRVHCERASSLFSFTVFDVFTMITVALTASLPRMLTSMRV